MWIVPPENIFTINWRVYVKKFEMQIIENISKYPVYPMRVCHGFCERRTASRSHAFSAEPFALASLKVHSLQFLKKKNLWQILTQKSGANFDAQALKLDIFLAIPSSLLPGLGKFTNNNHKRDPVYFSMEIKWNIINVSHSQVDIQIPIILKSYSHYLSEGLCYWMTNNEAKSELEWLANIPSNLKGKSEMN